MILRDVSIGQELVYLSWWPRSRPGPRIRVTEKIGYAVCGIVLDAMGGVWDKGSEFLCLSLQLYLPEDVPSINPYKFSNLKYIR